MYDLRLAQLPVAVRALWRAFQLHAGIPQAVRASRRGPPAASVVLVAENRHLEGLTVRAHRVDIDLGGGRARAPAGRRHDAARERDGVRDAGG